MRRLLKKQGFALDVLVTDKLRWQSSTVLFENQTLSLARAKPAELCGSSTMFPFCPS
jgi:hypothetical protein